MAFRPPADFLAWRYRMSLEEINSKPLDMRPAHHHTNSSKTEWNTPLGLLICFLLTSSPGLSFAVTAENTDQGSSRPHTGLVLSGGGALGLAHIGVLAELEKLNIPIDCIAGTSMGALVGGSYAAGTSPQHMQDIISNTDLASLFDDNPPRSALSQQLKQYDYKSLFDFNLGYNNGEFQLPAGAAAGYKFELFLKELIGQTAALSDINFDTLSVPYRAVATDLENGEMKVFDHGNLSRVMRASMSLPAVLAPSEVDGRVYIDGGLSRNLPVDIARELCGERIIAVNLGTTTKSRDQIHNSIDVALQSIVILTEQNVKTSIAELGQHDILLSPDLSDFDSSSFDASLDIIQRGAEAVRDNADRLQAFTVPAEDWQRWQAQRKQRILPTFKLGETRIHTSGYVEAEAIRRDLQSDKSASTQVLHDNLIDIFGRGDVSYIGYTLVPDESDDSQTADMLINAEGKRWGPGYLKLGLGAATDFSGPTQLHLSTSYRRTWVNSLGAEWRNEFQLGYDSLLRSEFIQPMQVRDASFIMPYLEISRSFLQLYQDELRLGDIVMRRAETGFKLGITSPSGEISIGPYISNTNNTPEFGIITSALPHENLRLAGVKLDAVIDQLDSYAFPRSGLHALLGYDINKLAWGSDSEYRSTRLRFDGARSFGKHTLAAKLEWAETTSDNDSRPLKSYFQLGGPLRLSGLYLDQLTGSRYDLATLSYYHQYASLPSQLGRGLYIGMSVETGRINDTFSNDSAQRIDAGSVYWGADTILGVAYIGYGMSSLNQRNWYLSIGPRF